MPSNKSHFGAENSNWRGDAKLVACRCGAVFRPANNRRQWCSRRCYETHPDTVARLRRQAGRAGALGAAVDRPRGGVQRDQNHALIVAAFEARGAEVHDLSALGNGVFDLVVIVDGVTEPVEIKNPASWYGRRGFNRAQWRFNAGWRGGQPWIVRTVEDVERVIEAARRKAAVLQHLVHS